MLLSAPERTMRASSQRWEAAELGAGATLRERNARASRRWPTGKNEETAGALRTTLGWPKYPGFWLLASLLFS